MIIIKTISEKGIKLIKSFEGCVLTAYDDLQPHVLLEPNTKILGTLTIGYGHTGNVKIGQTITQLQADSMLLYDLSRYIEFVNNSNYVTLTAMLNQNQFDALVSFCYNCGQGNLKNLCENKIITQISTGLLLYTKSKGVELAGLVRRRKAEKDLFDMEVLPMEQTNSDYLKRINDLEKIVKELIINVNSMSDKLTETEAPEYFLAEFPEALKMISTKTGNETFWRAFTVILRALRDLEK